MSDWFSLTKQRAVCEIFWYYNPFSQKTPPPKKTAPYKLKKKKIRHRPQLCVNMWERTSYFLIQSQVLSGLSYKPVKTDLDGAPWLGLNDPLTAQGVLVVARPPRGQNDTRWPWVVAPTRSWKVEKSGRRSTVKIKAAAKSKAELLFVFFCCCWIYKVEVWTSHLTWQSSISSFPCHFFCLTCSTIFT